MARKRKTEGQTSSKEYSSSTTRKSTRQMLKKELEEQRINGEIAKVIGISLEELQGRQKKAKEEMEKLNLAAKKTLKNKKKDNSEKSNNVMENRSEIENDGLDKDLTSVEKSEPEVSTEIITEEITNEMVWPSDIIEETIICEEMEVTSSDAVSSYKAQENNHVLEQLISDENEDNQIMEITEEFTVIQSENEIESMVVSSESDAKLEDNIENKECKNIEVIENSLSILHVTNNDCPKISNDNSVENSNIKSDKSPCKFSDQDNLEKISQFVHSSLDSIITSKKENSVKPVSVNKNSNKIDVYCTPKSPSISEDYSRDSEYDAKVEDMKLSSCSENSSDTFSFKKSPRKYENKTRLKKEIQNKNSIISQTSIENSKVSETENNSHSKKNKKINESPKQRSSSRGAKSENIEKVQTKPNISITSPSAFIKEIEQSKKDTNIPATQHNEDVKKNKTKETSISSLNLIADFDFMSIKNLKKISPKNEANKKSQQSDDIKISSSSDNSSDTSNYKISDESDKKFKTINTNASSSKSTADSSDDKNSSDSSAVRRSSRIRTIGLMKQRSRGRGLVVKPTSDIPKSLITSTEKEKPLNSQLMPQEKALNQQKPSSSAPISSQIDKDISCNKIIQDSISPSTSAIMTTGYDSDSNKPVKVKSRWRRSSELEMSNSANWTTFGFQTQPLSGPILTIQNNSIPNALNTDSSADSQNVPTLVPIPNCVDNKEIVENSTITGTVTIHPQVINSKIDKLETIDEELEERLKQFEQIKDNIYLSERYTNKETKKMICDCFLTEEEIERGELGCGEDCLNRLLMIECGSRCIVEDRCTNKRFQNCEYSKCEVFRTEKKGFGLRAVVDMQPGDFIMEYVGEVVNPKDFRKRAKEYSKEKNKHYYFMALKSDQIIDATMKGNISRFINHSCDPNAETQKWTVNGELRIGFFSTKFIPVGEELTFDYHFQRYGKEAQKCFCEAVNCRGWIGDNPDEQKEKVDIDIDFDSEEDEEEEEEEEESSEKEEKLEKQVKKKRERKVSDHMEDEDYEEELNKLCASGIKNKTHTLTLSRLMVRSREIQHRTRLLQVIQSGDQPCRRLFLDYHGLKLIWSYMMDVAGDESVAAQEFRLEVLKSLSTLPIPNKTMLIDSKILSVVEKWSKEFYDSPSRDSPQDEQNQNKLGVKDIEKNTSIDVKDDCEKIDEKQEKTENFENSIITDLANSLLLQWSNLKEVFRIPKKERIEQMKEHEREADRVYKEDLGKEPKDSVLERSRYNRNELDKRLDKRRGRDSPSIEQIRIKEKRSDERPNLVQVPQMSKFERRQLFALKVAKEEEERQRRQQQSSWQEHEAQCLALGLDPFTTAAFDSQTGYPLFFNHALGQWQPYPIQEGDVSQPCTPVFGVPPITGTPQANVLPQAVSSIPVVSADISPGLATRVPMPTVYPLNQPVTYPTFPYPPFPEANMQVPVNNLIPVPDTTPPLKVPSPSLAEKPTDIQTPLISTPETNFISQEETLPVIELPPLWKYAKDARNRIYYYHVVDRIPQWLPPPPDHIGVQPESSTESESSDESCSSLEEEEDTESQLEKSVSENMDTDMPLEQALANTKQIIMKKLDGVASVGLKNETKKRREGLVQERIISPRREEDRIDHKKFKEIKEKLKRQKGKQKLKEQLEKVRKHRRSVKSYKIAENKLEAAELSPKTERKIKDTFRLNMANVMVHFLNPYRKNDCKQGRITNTEDFKHLARKLTHFVLAKELKHCKSVDELECNENVKHKAKDFVKKYMSKFGPIYQKGTDED